jgi:hypothetical protein
MTNVKKTARKAAISGKVSIESGPAVNEQGLHLPVS